MHHFPLLADIEDLIEIAIVVLFLVGPVVAKLFQAKQPAKKPPAAPRKPPAAAPAGGGALLNPPAAQGPPGRDALEAEIEAFLKRAGFEPKKKEQAGRQPPKGQQRPAAGERRPDQPRRKPKSAIRPGQSVAQHVREHIESDSVGRGTQQLGQTVDQADERLEERLHRTFDHRVGQIDTAIGVDPADQVRQGTDDRAWETQLEKRSRRSTRKLEQTQKVREMLSDPGGVREAIILSEILRPPVGLR